MPPPYYDPMQSVATGIVVPARVCRVRRDNLSPWSSLNLRKGHRMVSLPVGQYEIMEIWRDRRYYHDIEHSDGCTYRLRAEDRDNPVYGMRVSVWQNDLYDAVEGLEEEDQ